MKLDMNFWSRSMHSQQMSAHVTDVRAIPISKVNEMRITTEINIKEVLI